MKTKRPKRVVLAYDVESGWGRIAEFELVEEVVHATYLTSGAHFNFEHNGIAIAGHELWPRDGRAFYDALLRALSRSAFIDVVDLEE